jgi:hypothetical protein
MLSRRSFLGGAGALLGAAAVPLLPAPGRAADVYGLAWSSDPDLPGYERWQVEWNANIYHRILVDGIEFKDVSHIRFDDDFVFIVHARRDADGGLMLDSRQECVVTRSITMYRSRVQMILESRETGRRLRAYS